MSASKLHGDEVVWEETFSGAAERWIATDPGQTLIGVYLGFETFTVNGPKGETEDVCYYDFRDKDGHIWSLTNSAAIVKGMKDVAVGKTVKITYLGEIDLGKPGKNAMKNYSVHVARS